MSGADGLILRARDVTKRFGGLVAVDDVDFEIPRRSIVSLIGPNGAGKTTFFNMIAGLYKPTSGAIELEGRPIAGLPPHRITSLGIARTFQNIRLFHNMTALENVEVGRHARMVATPFEAILRTPRERREGRNTEARARERLQILGVPGGRPTSSPRTCHTETSAGSRSRERSRPTRSCCSSTSRPPV